MLCSILTFGFILQGVGELQHLSDNASTLLQKLILSQNMAIIVISAVSEPIMLGVNFIEDLDTLVAKVQ